MRRPSLLLLTVALLGCGARSTLSVGPPAEGPPDAGRDASLDASLDASFDGGVDGGTLLVDCPRTPQFTTPRRAITLEALVESPSPISSSGWELLSGPPGSMPAFSVLPPVSATLLPDLQGSYFLRFSASDVAGRSASCEVEVQAIVGPPVAICPEEDTRTQVDVPVVVEGDGFDDEAIVAWQWELVDSPPGSGVTLDGVAQPFVTFTANLLGTYVLRLTVFDADMASGSCDAVVQVTGPPTVRCPSSPVRAPTRTPVTLTASAEDDVGIASHRWEVIARPSGSAAAPVPNNAPSVSFTPDKRGDYVLRYTVTDIEGLTASCEVTVVGLPTPPEIMCPETVETRPLTATPVSVTAIDDGEIVSWQWTLSSRPEGSGARPPSPANAQRTSFTPDIAGVYELTVTATDNDGMTDSCTIRVNAGNVDGLRIEMFWDTNGTDMDTHLLNPEATAWVNNNDCYYGNCVAGGGAPVLEWGAPGDDDDPRLDLDDTDGHGPENINITTPYTGTYRVGVHVYRGSGRHRVTVRIYCGGSTTTPRQTFGPVTLQESGGRRDFWRVADVALSPSGCTITDLTRADGRAWIESDTTMSSMR
jgi:hypothetical protein